MLWIEKNDHKVRYFPTITTRERYFKKDPYNGPDKGEQMKTQFYALQANKEANPDENSGKL